MRASSREQAPAAGSTRVPVVSLGGDLTAALYRLGGVCARRRWIVLAVWLVVAVALAAWARGAGSEVNDDLTLPGTDSQQATDLLDKRFPTQANGSNPVVLVSPAGSKITASRYQQPIDDTVSALRKDPDVHSAVNPRSSEGKWN